MVSDVRLSFCGPRDISSSSSTRDRCIRLGGSRLCMCGRWYGRASRSTREEIDGEVLPSNGRDRLGCVFETKAYLYNYDFSERSVMEGTGRILTLSMVSCLIRK